MKTVFWVIAIVCLLGYKETSPKLNVNGEYNYSEKIATTLESGLNTLADVCMGVSEDVFSYIDSKIDEYAN